MGGGGSRRENGNLGLPVAIDVPEKKRIKMTEILEKSPWE